MCVYIYTHMYIYIYIYTDIQIYVYIYIHIERERERCWWGIAGVYQGRGGSAARTRCRAYVLSWFTVSYRYVVDMFCYRQASVRAGGRTCSTNSMLSILPGDIPSSARIAASAVACSLPGRNKKPNRTGRTEPNRPNRTKPKRLIPEPDAETHRTEPDRPTTRPKNAGRTASNRDLFSPNRTEPNRTEPNRTEPNRTDEFSKSPGVKAIEPNRFPSCSVV